MDLLKDFFGLLFEPFKFLMENIPLFLIDVIPFTDYKLFGLIASVITISIYWMFLNYISNSTYYTGSLRTSLILFFFFVFVRETPSSYEEISLYVNISTVLSMVLITFNWFYNQNQEDQGRYES